MVPLPKVLCDQMTTIKKTSTYLIISILVIIAYNAFVIVTYANESNVVISDAAIILGAGIIYDKPSPVFRERIKYGITLYKTGKVKKLLFTGGLGKGKIHTESEVAKIYAINHGVHPSDILIEEKSTITYENISESQKVMNKNSLNSVLIVSDPLHMKRAMTMALDLGINANTAPTPTSMYKTWSTKLDFLVREIYFYIGYLFHRNFV